MILAMAVILVKENGSEALLWLWLEEELLIERCNRNTNTNVIKAFSRLNSFLLIRNISKKSRYSSTFSLLPIGLSPVDGRFVLEVDEALLWLGGVFASTLSITLIPSREFGNRPFIRNYIPGRVPPWTNVSFMDTLGAKLETLASISFWRLITQSLCFWLRPLALTGLGLFFLNLVPCANLQADLID